MATSAPRTVLDRETPIARIVPFVPAASADTPGAETDPAAAERMADLARQGVLSPGDPRAVADWLDSHPPVRLPAGSPSAVNVLLDMRRESQR